LIKTIYLANCSKTQRIDEAKEEENIIWFFSEDGKLTLIGTELIYIFVRRAGVDGVTLHT
jgi:hypothetical protein